MGIKDNIESLFDSEGVQQEAETPAELNKIDLGIERRQFTRVDVTERKIGIRFNNEMQFARQYIENISLGGLFVKTSQKHEMGDIITLEFKVPNPSSPTEEINFCLKGSVCRITEAGVGFEFTNLTQETRSYLETYVRSVLPPDTGIRTKPKASTVERIEQMRKSRQAASKARQKLGLRVLFVASLLLLNAVLVQQSVKEFRSQKIMKVQKITVSDNEIDLNKIKTVHQDKDGNLWIESDNQSIRIDNQDIRNQLPPHLRHQSDIVESAAPIKPIRRSKNAAGLINTRKNR